jgi:hypothetical protein
MTRICIEPGIFHQRDDLIVEVELENKTPLDG